MTRLMTDIGYGIDRGQLHEYIGKTALKFFDLSPGVSRGSANQPARRVGWFPDVDAYPACACEYVLQMDRAMSVISRATSSVPLRRSPTPTGHL
jgi:hypothetical protein